MKKFMCISWLLGVLLMPCLLLPQEKGKTPLSGQTSKETPKDYVPYDKPPEVLNQEQPKYPELALRAGLEGTVWVKLWVDTTGRVVQVYVQKSDAEIFEQASLDAARQWRFKPAILKGKTISTWVTVPFRFKIGGYPTETRTEGSPVKRIVGNTLGIGWQESLLLLSIVSLFVFARIVLALIAVVDIVRSQFIDPNDKIVWAIVSVMLPIFGPILYFIIGKKHKIQNVNAIQS
jgi:TonB family protein